MVNSPEPEAQVTPHPPEQPQLGIRLLHIENRSPGALYLEVLKQTTSKNMMTRLAGDKIGSVEPSVPGHPLQEIETRIRVGWCIHNGKMIPVTREASEELENRLESLV